MLKIKLARVGKRKYAVFKIIISEKSKDTQGDYLELLGNYNPHLNKINLKADRIKYWLSKGAQVTDTLHNLLIDQKIISGKKINVIKIKKGEEKGEKEKIEEKTKEKLPESKAVPKQPEKKSKETIKQKEKAEGKPKEKPITTENKKDSNVQ